MADDVNLVADLILTGDGEAADAGRFVLHIEAVEERGVLVVAGGIGGYHTLNGEAVTGVVRIRRSANISNRGNGAFGFLVENIKLDVGSIGVLLALKLDHSRHGDGGELGLGKGMDKVDGQSAIGRDRVGVGISADHFAALDGIGQGLDCGSLIFLVVEGGGQRSLFILIDGLGSGLNIRDTKFERLAHPDRRGHCEVTVFLGHTDEVVAVLRVKLHTEPAGSELRCIAPGVGRYAAVHDDFNLADGVAGIGIEEGDHDVQLLRRVFIAEDRTHRAVVERVVNLQVLILGGIYTQRADGVINTLLGEVVRQDNVAGIVGIAPAALVVILVVGGRHMPALVQRNDVLFVAGVITAGADLAFAVADLDQEHVLVGRRIPIGEVGEVAEGRARVVELVQAVALVDGLVVELHAGVAALVVQLGIVAGYQTVTVEGVDMAGTGGPGHLKARDGNDAVMALVERGDRVLVTIPEFLARRGHQALVIERIGGVGGAGGIKVVGVVSEGHELDICALRQGGHVLQRGIQRTGTVGVSGVGVQLAEVKLIGRNTNGKAPALFSLHAVGALHGDLHGHTAVGQILRRRVAQHAVGKHGLNGLVVDGHRECGILANVPDLHGDGRLLLLAGLGVGCRGQFLKEGHVDDLNGLHTAVLNTVAVGHVHLDGEAGGVLVAVDISGGNRKADGLGRFNVRHGAGLAAGGVRNGDAGDLLCQIVQREGAEVILLDEAGILAVKDDRGVLNNVIIDLGAVNHFIEVEEEDGGISRLKGPAGEDAGIIFNADRRAVVVGFLIINNVAVAVLGQEPLGSFGQLAVLILLDEEELFRVVGGQVLAVDLKAVVAAHRIDGEDVGAVACLGLAAHDGGGHRGQGVGGLLGKAQRRLGIGVVGHILLALLQNAVPFAVVKGFNGVVRVDQIELQRKVVLGELVGAGGGEVAGEDLRAVADISFDIGRASVGGDRGAAEVEAVRRFGRGQRPGVVRILGHVYAQLGIGTAGPYRDAAGLIIVGIEAVGAVVVDLYGPDHVVREVDNLAAFHGAGVGLQVPVAVGLGADGSHVSLAVDRNGRAVGQLIQAGDKVTVGRLRLFLDLNKVELHAVGFFRQLALTRGVAAEDGRLIIVDLLVKQLNVAVAITGGQAVAGNIISMVGFVADRQLPGGVAAGVAGVGGQFHIGAAQVAGNGFAALLKAVAAVLVDTHGPNEVCRGIDREIVLDGHFAGPQVPVFIGLGAHSLGAVRVVNHNLCAVGQLSQIRYEAKLLRRFF